MEEDHCDAVDIDHTVRRGHHARLRLHRSAQLLVQHHPGRSVAVCASTALAFHVEQAHHGLLAQQRLSQDHLLSHSELRARSQLLLPHFAHRKSEILLEDSTQLTLSMMTQFF